MSYSYIVLLYDYYYVLYVILYVLLFMASPKIKDKLNIQYLC